MKKSLVVLLIAVLALSAVFADFSLTAAGDLAASYTVDLDEKTATYDVSGIEGEFGWTAAWAKAVKGEGYPYVDVEASIAIDFLDDEDVHYPAITTSPTIAFNDLGVSIDKFAIVGEDWVLNLIDDEKFVDYAVSAIDTALEREKITKAWSTVPYSLPNAELKGADDYAVSFTKEGFGKVKVMGQKDTSDTSLYASIESEEFAITEDLSAKLAGVFSNGYGVSAQFIYDDVAKLAFDIVNGDFDITANLKLGFVDFDAFFATKAQPKFTADYIPVTGSSVENYLSARAIVTLEDLGTVVTVTGRGLGIGPNYVDVEAVNTVVDGYTFDAAVYGLNYSGPFFHFAKLGAKANYEDEGLEIGLGAEFFGYPVPVVKANVAYTGSDIVVEGSFAYDLGNSYNVYASKEAYYADTTGTNIAYSLVGTFTASKYVAKAGVYMNSLDDPAKAADYYAFLEGLHVGASITSDIVNGAELSLVYTSGELFEEDGLGSVTAAVTVEF